MQTLLHNLGLVTICGLISAAVLVLELAVAARIDKRHRPRRQVNA